jgi:hypothetical protein
MPMLVPANSRFCMRLTRRLHPLSRLVRGFLTWIHNHIRTLITLNRVVAHLSAHPDKGVVSLLV